MGDKTVLCFMVILWHAASSARVNFTDKNVLETSSRLKRQAETCTLPPYPENGQYSAAGAPDARPGQTLQAVQLTVSCHPGYRPKDYDVLYCVAGTWSAEVPHCVRHCRLDPHPSVKYRCSASDISGFDEGFRDCRQYEPVGTTVRPLCNKPNYYYNGVKTLMRCIDGRWDHVVVCTPDCGRVTPEGKPLIVGGWRSRRGEFPWHAGIYLKPFDQNSEYQQICGGSVISTKVVVSAAHCFWSRGRVRKVETLAVAVGKLYRRWNDPNDEDAQKFNVANIKIPLRYQDEATNYQDDIAAVVLSAEIVYRPHVRPVCVDFDPVFDSAQLKPGAIGKVAGWGYTDKSGIPSPVLKVLDMPYVRVDQCIAESPETFRPFITSDKICAGFQNGSAVCRGDSGGGLVFPAMDRGVERYYLRGIVSTAPKSDNDECNSYARASFTQIVVHSIFIEENLNIFDFRVEIAQELPNNQPCVLPPYPPNGKYLVAGTPSAVPGQTFLSAQLEIKCNPGFLPERNVWPSCSYGRWSDGVPDCVRQGPPPECGRVSSQINQKTSLPWHASIYRRTPEFYQQTCGGTLVSSTVVITAARCVWSTTEHYTVAVGKTRRPFDTIGDDHTQRSDVLSVKIPDSFSREAHFDSDIAIVTMKTPVMFTNFVTPVCVDFDIELEKQQLRSGNVGKVPGWSSNDENTSSVQVEEVPLLGEGECTALSPPEFQRFLTADKLCAGWKDKAGECNKGDRGAGLVFPDTRYGTQRFYLRGVVSTRYTKLECQKVSFTTFTGLSRHQDFIRQHAGPK